MLDVRLVDGDLQAYNTFINGDELVIQRVNIRFKTHRGEWLLDESVGIPFIEWADRRGLSINTVVLQCREEVDTTPGVASSDLEGQWDPHTREHTVTGRAVLSSRRVVPFAVAPLDTLGQPTDPVLGA